MFFGQHASKLQCMRCFLIATTYVEPFHGESHWMGRSCVMLHGLSELWVTSYKCYADLTRYINGAILKLCESCRELQGDFHFLSTRGSTCIFEANRVAAPDGNLWEVPLFVESSWSILQSLGYYLLVLFVQTDVSFVIPLLGKYSNLLYMFKTGFIAKLR